MPLDVIPLNCDECFISVLDPKNRPRFNVYLIRGSKDRKTPRRGVLAQK